MEPTSKFIPTAKAAEYISYSRRQLLRYVEEFSIPTYGPRKNRFNKDDLDQFMANPLFFKQEKKQFSARKKRGFTPISIDREC
ncbi:MerR family transcriptional regulator [Maridesulfovibrio frigidus]|uniref:hypothetical protein n=1 Tax=Maridesulfovibrio frigidus TaxID=340956 RepID=UPI0004E20CEA|nr:hypothetical protein [Maridesulfovibrio frigidus]